MASRLRHPFRHEEVAWAFERDGRTGGRHGHTGRLLNRMPLCWAGSTPTISFAVTPCRGRACPLAATRPSGRLAANARLRQSRRHDSASEPRLSAVSAMMPAGDHSVHVSLDNSAPTGAAVIQVRNAGAYAPLNESAAGFPATIVTGVLAGRVHAVQRSACDVSTPAADGHHHRRHVIDQERRPDSSPFSSRRVAHVYDRAA
jgi:hypothetical protein